MDHLSPVALIACVSAVLISSGFVQLCFGQQGNFNLTSINSTSAVQSMRAMCAGNGSNVFERNCIVPDLIDVSPPDILEVLYPTGITVMYGNEMTAHMVQNPPALVAWKADPCKFYTLSKSDLDTPSRANPTRSPLKHWLVINIPGRNVDKGDILGTYFGANPADGTGPHRYVFLAFLQNSKIDATDSFIQSLNLSRMNFEIRDFARNFSLGNPVAGNFYVAQFQLPVNNSSMDHTNSSSFALPDSASSNMTRLSNSNNTHTI
ncbi:hypothetical protein RvY_15260-1 [Ramazzottius varieornatus]|uniref:Phosphatidylethanolamine-binding protein n=1 Tax=Ramazzottius varieornatus TaxID=947166 RepID=A0A1D1VU89_RAMVA|nr:hypothetical protein RvY_15260-1 [Ramazzottius varieornatus]